MAWLTMAQREQLERDERIRKERVARASANRIKEERLKDERKTNRDAALLRQAQKDAEYNRIQAAGKAAREWLNDKYTIREIAEGRLDPSYASELSDTGMKRLRAMRPDLFSSGKSGTGLTEKQTADLRLKGYEYLDKQYDSMMNLDGSPKEEFVKKLTRKDKSITSKAQYRADNIDAFINSLVGSGGGGQTVDPARAQAIRDAAVRKNFEKNLQVETRPDGIKKYTLAGVGRTIPDRLASTPTHRPTGESAIFQGDNLFSTPPSVKPATAIGSPNTPTLSTQALNSPVRRGKMGYAGIPTAPKESHDLGDVYRTRLIPAAQTFNRMFVDPITKPIARAARGLLNTALESQRGARERLYSLSRPKKKTVTSEMMSDIRQLRKQYPNLSDNDLKKQARQLRGF